MFYFIFFCCIFVTFSVLSQIRNIKYKVCPLIIHTEQRNKKIFAKNLYKSKLYLDFIQTYILCHKIFFHDCYRHQDLYYENLMYCFISEQFIIFRDDAGWLILVLKKKKYIYIHSKLCFERES